MLDEQVMEPDLSGEWPADLLQCLKGLFWAERILSVKIETPYGLPELHNVHIPAATTHPNPDTRGWIKPYHMEAIYKYLLTHELKGHRILCGDFNTSKEEWYDGRAASAVQTFTSTGELIFNGRVDSRGNRRGYPAIHFARSELRIIKELTEFGLPDQYRLIHGYSDIHVYSKFDNKRLKENKAGICYWD